MPMTPDDTSGDDGDTQSLTHSITDYPFEHGRRYHKYHEGLYPYPNDEQELDRLNVQHYLYKMANEDRLFFSPLTDPKKILDVGTGTGIWAIEMAALFPEATITGTDLSPVQPNEVPENVHFLVDDATEEDWMWGPDHFDLVHLANMGGSFSCPIDIMRTASIRIKPGGYLEWHEIDPRPTCDDDTLPPVNPDGYSEYPLHDWVDLNEQAGKARDPPRPFRIAHQLARWMKEVGYVDVQERITKIPMNAWPNDPQLKEVGSCAETIWTEALAAYSYKPFLSLGLSKAEIEVFLVSVRNSVRNQRVHAYNNLHTVTGRKRQRGEQ
ncbi:hypothetical protein Egran_06629 [Elaphomyces granulatus]|uniref:Methyltransferase domain-containing protein n=1 Tax=Elaphomyces granulatus TaxID=519963 RepID=A0A232LN66_9EURO|nr:hypothetical protein Egran_06629 [Elaphomyces granulatus]